MRVADRIDVVAFHQDNVLFHSPVRNRPPCVRIKFMPVDPLKGDRAAIKHDLLIYNSDVPKAHHEPNDFKRGTICIQRFNQQ